MEEQIKIQAQSNGCGCSKPKNVSVVEEMTARITQEERIERIRNRFNSINRHKLFW